MHTLCFIIMITIMIAIPRSSQAQSSGEATTVEQLQELRREVEALQERLASLESDVAIEQEMAAKTLIGGYIQTTFTDFE